MPPSVAPSQLPKGHAHATKEPLGKPWQARFWLGVAQITRNRDRASLLWHCFYRRFFLRPFLLLRAGEASANPGYPLRGDSSAPESKTRGTSILCRNDGTSGAFTTASRSLAHASSGRFFQRAHSAMLGSQAIVSVRRFHICPQAAAKKRVTLYNISAAASVIRPLPIARF
jgi:hypothetical protein